MALLSLFRGDHRHATVVVADRNGVPLNLTDCLLEFTVRHRVSGELAVLYKTNAPGGDIEITDAPAGRATIHLAPEDTADLSTTPRYVWDLQVTDDVGPLTVNYGRFVLRPDVTREVAGS